MAKVGDVETALREVFGEKAFLTEQEVKSRKGIFEVIAREKGHREAKKALGGRVQVLRVLIQRHYRDKQKKEGINEFDYFLRCEKYLDNILADKKYDIEFLIDRFRENTVIDGVVMKCPYCAYVPPFCEHWDYDEKVFKESA